MEDQPISSSSQSLLNQQKKLSDAFPPESVNNYETIAIVHERLKGVNVEQLKKEMDKRIIIRSVQCQKDLKQIKDLHAEWFPLPYDDSYFNKIENGEIQSIIIEINLPKKQGKFIVGCLFFSQKRLKGKYAKFSPKQLCFDFSSVYITTLGVVHELRSLGLASVMMKQLQNFCQSNKNIQYIYLHIVDYNKTGIKYYLKNNFILIEKKYKHYSNIEGNSYDAYIFAYYLHGAEPTKGMLLDMLSSLIYPLKAIINLFKSKKSIENTNNNNKES